MSIGSQLKQAREAKDISIQEVSVKIKIQQKFLEALEEDKISSLPNLIYAKGFLRNYAEFLGLDVKKLMLQLENAGLEQAKQVILLEGEQLPAIDAERYFKKVLVGIAVFLVLAGVVVFLFSVYKGGVAKVREKSTRQIKTRPVIRQSSSVKQAELKHQLVKPPAKVSTIFLTLAILVKKPCRFSIKADNSLLFEGFLSPGRLEQWQAKDRFQLDITDGTAVELTLNGKRLGSIGRGVLKKVLITKDGIKRR